MVLNILCLINNCFNTFVFIFWIFKMYWVWMSDCIRKVTLEIVYSGFILHIQDNFLRFNVNVYAVNELSFLIFMLKSILYIKSICSNWWQDSTIIFDYLDKLMNYNKVIFMRKCKCGSSVISIWDFIFFQYNIFDFSDNNFYKISMKVTPKKYHADFSLNEIKIFAY